MRTKSSGGGRGGGGEIVPVNGGGHILRPTGRKDRHSKVYTAKGPRDRRVRLSAPTAIQFYDVQDRLGYDRPSKAVDWLLEKAQHAIDMLEELPQWNQDGCSTMAPTGGGLVVEKESDSSPGYDGFQLPSQNFEPPAIDQQAVSGDSLMNFHGCRNDLCLTLHSLHDPNSGHGHTSPTTHQPLFSSPDPVTFPDSFPRIYGGGEENRVGFSFNSRQEPQPPPILWQNQVLSDREPLQSSFLQLLNSWNYQPLPEDNRNTQTISGSQFASDFRMPARIHGEEEPEITEQREAMS